MTVRVIDIETMTLDQGATEIEARAQRNLEIDRKDRESRMPIA